MFEVKPSSQRCIVISWPILFIISRKRIPNLAWIRKGYHGCYACMTDNAVSALANTKFYKYSTCHSKEKSHERRYNDIYRLRFSVTTCIRIQSHLSEFTRNVWKRRIYVILCTGLWLRLLLADQQSILVSQSNETACHTRINSGDYFSTSKS